MATEAEVNEVARLYPALVGSALKMPWQFGWTRGLSRGEVEQIIRGNTAAAYMVELAGGVQAFLDKTDAGKRSPKSWPFSIPSLGEVQALEPLPLPPEAIPPKPGERLHLVAPPAARPLPPNPFNYCPAPPRIKLLREPIVRSPLAVVEAGARPVRVALERAIALARRDDFVDRVAAIDQEIRGALALAPGPVTFLATPAAGARLALPLDSPGPAEYFPDEAFLLAPDPPEFVALERAAQEELAALDAEASGRQRAIAEDLAPEEQAALDLAEPLNSAGDEIRRDQDFAPVDNIEDVLDDVEHVDESEAGAAAAIPVDDSRDEDLPVEPPADLTGDGDGGGGERELK